MGALALHVAMVACGSAPPMAGDAGVLADVRDAVVDALRDVVDAETPDAFAGDDAGACACPPAVETSFTVSGMTRDGSAETPLRDYSTARLDVSAVPLEDHRARDPMASGPGYNIAAQVDFRTADSSRVLLRCNDVTVRPDRTLLPGLTCAVQVTRAAADGDGGVRLRNWVAETPGPDAAVTVEVARLEDARVEVRLTGVRFLATTTTPGVAPVVVAIDNLTITSARSGGSFLAPSRALR